MTVTEAKVDGGQPGSRVHHVIAAFVTARSRDGTVADRDNGRDPIPLPRMLDADAPSRR